MGTVKHLLLPEGAVFATSSFAQLGRVYGTNFPIYYLAYDAAATERAFWHFQAVNYGSGNITCTINWYPASATTNVVKFETAIAAITPNSDATDVETKAFATAQTGTDTVLGGNRAHSVDITVSNLDSVAADDWVWFRISRLGADAADTMTGDAVLVSAVLSYSDA